MAIVAIVSTLLAGCGKFDTGSSAPPPPWVGVGATPGDGRVTLEWTPTAGVDYWVFAATNPALTAFNWTSLPNAQAVVASPTPAYICGLVDEVNGTPLAYYFATNGRINNGPGGPSSPTISATPYNASAKAWSLNPTSLIQDIYGLGYAGMTTCANNTTLSATGMFAAVGANGVIFTSPDGINWTQRSSPVLTNLNAVTGYAATQNAEITGTNPGLLWVAVGDGGTAAYSTDGVNWLASPTSTTQTLRSIMHVAGTFFAVGDAGTLVSTTNGYTWATLPIASTTAVPALNSVTYGAGVYLAVGNNGTIVSDFGSGWAVTTAPNSLTTNNLRGVAAAVTAYGTVYVAVGDNGTIITRTNNSNSASINWTSQTLPIPAGSTNPPNLVSVVAEPLAVETTTAYTTAPLPDNTLGFIAALQFVAIDDAGNTYTSLNGYAWTPSVSTGISCTLGTTCMNPLLSSGFGYVAAGNGGATAYSF